MTTASRFILCTFTGLLPLLGTAQTLDEIFDGLITTEMAGYASIDNYLVVTETMGVSAAEFYEKVSSYQQDGRTHYVMRLVPINELQERESPDNPLTSASSTELRNAADLIEQQGQRAQMEFERELADSGVGSLGGGALGNMLLNPPPDEPWLSANPKDMTSMYATMLRGAADAKDYQAAQDPEADAQRNAAATRQVKENSRIIGEETIDGRPAVGIMADNVAMTQNSNGQEFTLNSVTMWVDKERFVPLRLSMKGVATGNGQPQEMNIERDDMDYQQVQGCGNLLKPMHSVMRLGGALTAEQQQQMQEARAQMAQMQQQLARLPESQKAMIMRQMGPQMEMMEKMMSGGGIEVESRIISIKCNATAQEALDGMVNALTNSFIN